MATPVPSFYRIYFTIVDPIFSLIGAYGNLFTPTSVLTSYSTSFADPPAVETVVLLDTSAGFLTSLACLQAGLLRAKPTDIVVWRTLQASTLPVALFKLWAFWRALRAENRTGWRALRPEEWTNLGVTVGIAAIRTAFLLGFGMGGKVRGKKA